MKSALPIRPCPNCGGRRFIRVYYSGIKRGGQQACQECKGRGWVYTRPPKVKRLVHEGPDPD
jgi:DNA-directed RNA polymerase subunit RPC12/RpoP